VLFNPALADFVRSHPNELDYLAIIPDRTWADHGPHASPRFEELPAVTALLEKAAEDLRLVMHSIGMSICSAGLFDQQYLDHLAAWRERYNCLWASDHLSFTRFGLGHETNSAFALPVPWDREVLDLIVPRARVARERLGCPFLLENNVSYIRFPDEEMSEAQFLNRLMAESGCGILLDLHNLHTNARNHAFDPIPFLQALETEGVLEIHVAGGDELMGFHTDSHAGPVLEEVWTLLEAAGPRFRSLRGVTFEFHESSWPLLREDGVLAQIERARSILARVADRAACAPGVEATGIRGTVPVSSPGGRIGPQE
jgi:uncharacterized protein (UPF0276 family)